MDTVVFSKKTVAHSVAQFENFLVVDETVGVALLASLRGHHVLECGYNLVELGVHVTLVDGFFGHL